MDKVPGIDMEKSDTLALDLLEVSQRHGSVGRSHIA